MYAENALLIAAAPGHARKSQEYPGLEAYKPPERLARVEVGAAGTFKKTAGFGEA